MESAKITPFIHQEAHSEPYQITLINIQLKYPWLSEYSILGKKILR